LRGGWAETSIAFIEISLAVVAVRVFAEVTSEGEEVGSIFGRKVRGEVALAQVEKVLRVCRVLANIAVCIVFLTTKTIWVGTRYTFKGSFISSYVITEIDW